MRFCLLREHFIGGGQELWVCCFLGGVLTFLFLLVWSLLFLLPSLLKSVSLQDKWCLVKKMFSLNSAGVLLLSQLPGGQRRALTCTRISRQSSRTFCRSRSSTSDICSGNAPPLCPCRGCSLCHSTSGHSCRSHWKSCCIVCKKENAVSECRFLQGFSQTVWWIQHSEHPASSSQHLRGWQRKPWAALTPPAVAPKITFNSCSDSQFGPGSIHAPTQADKQSSWDTSTTRTNHSKQSVFLGRLQNHLKAAERRWHLKEQTVVFVYPWLTWKGWRRNPTARRYLCRLHAKDPRLGGILAGCYSHCAALIPPGKSQSVLAGLGCAPFSLWFSPSTAWAAGCLAPEHPESWPRNRQCGRSTGWDHKSPNITQTFSACFASAFN